MSKFNIGDRVRFERQTDEGLELYTGIIESIQRYIILDNPVETTYCVKVDQIADPSLFREVRESELSLYRPKVEQKSERHNAGKTQTREVDPDFILGIGEVLTKSREKYDHFNWCKDTPFSTPYESMMRHLLAFQKGENNDNDTNCNHLLHAATNIMFLYFYFRNYPELDDREFKKYNKKLVDNKSGQ